MKCCPLCDEEIAPVVPQGAHVLRPAHLGRPNALSFAAHLLFGHFKDSRCSCGVGFRCLTLVDTTKQLRSHLTALGNFQRQCEHLRFHSLGNHP